MSENKCTFDKWLPSLMTRLPGITEELLRHEILAVLREFCNDGRAWTEEFGPLSAKENNPIIQLDPLFQSARVGNVWLAIFNSGKGVQKALAPMSTPPYLQTVANEPVGYFMEETGRVQLSPTPNQDLLNMFFFTLSIVPTTLETRLPELFWTKWNDAIIDGACGRCMMMISKPWSNPSMGTYHLKRFRNHIKIARAETSTQFSQSQPWRFPDFARQRVGEGLI